MSADLIRAIDEDLTDTEIAVKLVADYDPHMALVVARGFFSQEIVNKVKDLIDVQEFKVH